MVETTLRLIPELGFVRVGGGSLQLSLPPRELEREGVVMKRWEPTMHYLRSYAAHHRDWQGEFFVTIYDAWREYSWYVPEAERKYVPWTPALNRFFSSHGARREPRFCHRHPDNTIYPVLCRPVLTYNRHLKDRGALLIPDAHLIMGEFDRFRKMVETSDVAFDDKPVRDRILWRGSKNVSANRYHVRMQAVKATALNRIKGLDASFDFMDVATQLQHPYLLDLDGFASAWSAFYWKMLSRSVVIKHDSGWEQWYYDSLAPNEHYIPIDSLRSVPRVLAWCRDHPEECKRISQSATQFASRIINWNHAVKYYTIA